MRRSPPKSSRYAVGYRRPPKSTQFKRGKSGNPKGRPAGNKHVASVLLNVIGQKITVTENGRTRRLPAVEVMLRRLANDAMRNEPRALKLMLSLIDRYADTPETTEPIERELAEDREILARYLGTRSGLSGNPAARSND
jgi:Family of unknown function (DUF5681)